MKKRVYFYCLPYLVPDFTAYQHGLISFAEGLEDLGIPFSSNSDYWMLEESPRKYLFELKPTITHEDCDLVVVSSSFFEYGGAGLPSNLFGNGRKYKTVYLDQHDTLYSSSFRPEMSQFDFIFRAHFNSRFENPKNMHPMAFGLTKRILKATEKTATQRSKSILHNFRVPHPVRTEAESKIISRLKESFTIDTQTESFEPSAQKKEDLLLWIPQTGRRHYPKFYERLAIAQGCTAFGGYFTPALPAKPFARFNAVTQKIPFGTRRVYSYDSWRFWESLASGAATFHIDFDRYGAQLQVQPKNWEHYIGFNFENLDSDFKKIKSDPDLLNRIGKQGRSWVKEHYSPKAVAKYLLEKIGF